MRRWSRILSAAAAALLLGAGVAAAQGRGNSHHKVPPGLARTGGVPPGLAKKGGLPPGQAKKIYRVDQGVGVLRDVFGRHGYTVARTARRGDAWDLYYRMRDGETRRATVRPGSSRLQFLDVPNSVLRDVLARLY